MVDEPPEFASTTPQPDAPHDPSAEVNSPPGEGIDGAVMWNSMDLPGMEPAGDNE